MVFCLWACLSPAGGTAVFAGLGWPRWQQESCQGIFSGINIIYIFIILGVSLIVVQPQHFCYIYLDFSPCQIKSFVAFVKGRDGSCWGGVAPLVSP